MGTKVPIFICGVTTEICNYCHSITFVVSKEVVLKNDIGLIEDWLFRYQMQRSVNLRLQILKRSVHKISNAPFCSCSIS